MERKLADSKAAMEAEERRSDENTFYSKRTHSVGAEQRRSAKEAVSEAVATAAKEAVGLRPPGGMSVLQGQV